jgi:DNA (cytosine-5)-methyltransferase 1
MRHLDLFSGIGGFALAVDHVWYEEKNEHTFCEIDQFCQAVLKKHWPTARTYSDIRELKLHRGTADIITGGFPCQPFSSAGARRGTEDDRHLWPEMLRVIRDVSPRWVVGENVRGLTNWSGGLVFDEVQSDLESAGYEVLPFLLPAIAVNAPHRRDRIWIVAHAKDSDDRGGAREVSQANEQIREARPIQRATELGGTDSRSSNPTSERSGTWGAKREGQQREATSVIANSITTNTERCGRNEGRGKGMDTQEQTSKRPQFSNNDWQRDWPQVATELCRMDDGLPAELDGLKLSKAKHREQRIHALGNAIVPQVAMEILQTIKLYELNK